MRYMLASVPTSIHLSVLVFSLSILQNAGGNIYFENRVGCCTHGLLLQKEEFVKSSETHSCHWLLMSEVKSVSTA